MNDHSASATHDNRVCIIGCGRVGMASAYALIQSSFIRELVLVGRDRERTEGEVMDLEHAVAVPMKSPINVINGSYADAASSSVVVIAAGKATGGSDTSRLDLLDANAPIVREIVGKLKKEGFDGVIVMATNPVDLLVQVALEESGLPTGQVVGTGTLVDTARLRGMLAEAFDIEPRGVDAYIIGEHGDPKSPYGAVHASPACLSSDTRTAERHGTLIGCSSAFVARHPRSFVARGIPNMPSACASSGSAKPYCAMSTRFSRSPRSLMVNMV
jgi:hypothetical protein